MWAYLTACELNSAELSHLEAKSRSTCWSGSLPGPWLHYFLLPPASPGMESVSAQMHINLQPEAFRCRFVLAACLTLSKEGERREREAFKCSDFRGFVFQLLSVWMLSESDQ